MWLPVEEERTDRVVLVAFEDHWNTERGPRLRRVVFRNDLDPAEALDLACTTEGEVDIVTDVQPADAQRVIDSEHAQLEVIDAMRLIVGVINRGADDVPLDDVRVRRGLNLAIDQQQLIDTVFHGYAHPLVSMTPHFAAGFAKDLDGYGHDPDEARRLLEDAGWPSERPLRLAAPEPLTAVAELVREQLADALGIEVATTIIPPEELLVAQHVLVEKELPAPFDLLIHAWFDLSADAPLAAIHREFFARDGAFRAGPPIERFDELFDDYRLELDPDTFDERAAAIDRFVHDEALAVFLCNPQALYAVNRHVRFAGYAATFELADTEVTEDHWSRR